MQMLMLTRMIIFVSSVPQDIKPKGAVGCQEDSSTGTDDALLITPDPAFAQRGLAGCVT